MKKTLSVVAVFGLAMALICPSNGLAQCTGCSQSAVQTPVFAGAPIQSYQSYQSVPVSNSYQMPAAQSYGYSQPVVYGSSMNTSNVSAYNSYPTGSVVTQNYPSQVYSNQVYSSPVYSNPVVSNPVVSNPVVSNQTYSNPVYAAPAQTYSTASYPMQTNPVQSYVPQTYATQTYASQSYPSTYAAQSYPGTYSQTYTASGRVASQPVYSQRNYSQTYATSNYSGSNRYASTGSVSPGLAQQKAVQAAQMGLQGHVGGGLGGAKYEGVGWSNQGPQHAIEKCCYWGARPTAQIGVTRGNNGLWYACVLYN